LVDAIYVRQKFLIDETRPTGFEIAESFPELVSMIHLHVPHDSTVVNELAKRNELEIAFIDGDHRHPCPLLDLLRLAPYIASAGWIVLHDIQLGTIGCKAIEAGQALRRRWPYGAEWVLIIGHSEKSGANTSAQSNFLTIRASLLHLRCV
jgi:hypothetical protein